MQSNVRSNLELTAGFQFEDKNKKKEEKDGKNKIKI
jgi:hypothetical protein